MADAADPEDTPLDGPLIEQARFDIWVKTRRLWTIEQGIQLYLGVEPFDDDHDFLSLSRELLNKNGGSRGISGWRVMARDMFARAEDAVKTGDILPFDPSSSIETDYRKVKVYPAEFMRWLVSALEQLPDGLRYTIPCELLPLLETDADGEVPGNVSLQDTDIKRVDRRVERIKEAISSLSYTAMSIPDGGKKQIKKWCLDKYNKEPERFTESTFEQAWKKALKDGVVRMLHHSKYSGK